MVGLRMTEAVGDNLLWHDGPSWLKDLSQSHQLQLNQLDVVRELKSIWRYTNMSTIESFALKNHPATVELDADFVTWVDQHRLEGYEAFIFVNGCFDLVLSDAQTEDVFCWKDHHTLSDSKSVLAERLSRPLKAIARFDMGFVQSGLSLDVQAKQTRRIQVLNVYTAAYAEQKAGLKHIITVGESAHLDLVEMHLAQEISQVQTCQVMSIDLAPHSFCEHNRIMLPSFQAESLMHDECVQSSQSTYRGGRFMLSLTTLRGAFWADLKGSQADCQLMGLYLGQKQAQMHQFTQIHHQVAEGKSNQVYRAIASDSACVNLQGRVIIDQGADQVDADQQGKHLLLDSGAQINTLPELEVYADDVTCTHGACIGQLDEDALYYCQSRGMALEEAKTLLMLSHLNYVVNSLSDDKLKQRLTLWCEDLF